jgi:hypothetical protein
VRIHQTNSPAVQTARLDHVPNLDQLRRLYLWQKVEQRQDSATLLEGAKSKLPNYQGMDYNLTLA